METLYHTKNISARKKPIYFTKKVKMGNQKKKNIKEKMFRLTLNEEYGIIVHNIFERNGFIYEKNFSTCYGVSYDR